MTFLVSGLALTDLDEIFAYYENQRPGLGQDFITEFHLTAQRIRIFPRGWAKVSKRSRRCQFNRFPYAAYYKVSRNVITVFAIWHMSRADSWRARE